MHLVEHLATRGCDVNKYHVWLSEDKATFPLYGFNGALVGFQQYTPDAPKKCDRPSQARYFTRSSRPALWGLETLSILSKGDVVFVCESIFKAMAVHRVGHLAVSSLGSQITRCLRQQMMLFSCEWVCLGDDDRAGQKFSEAFRRGAVSKDLDELSVEQVRNIVEPFLTEKP